MYFPNAKGHHCNRLIQYYIIDKIVTYAYQFYQFSRVYNIFDHRIFIFNFFFILFFSILNCYELFRHLRELFLAMYDLFFSFTIFFFIYVNGKRINYGLIMVSTSITHLHFFSLFFFFFHKFYFSHKPTKLNDGNNLPYYI